LSILFCYIPPSSTTELTTIFKHVKSDNFIVIGDINARISDFQTKHSLNNIKRSSKDTHLNTKGREIIKCLEESNLYVVNGTSLSDPQGEYTFCSKLGNSVIDLCMCTRDLSTQVDFSVLEEVDTEHHPIMLMIQGKETVKSSKPITRMLWKDEKAEPFRQTLDYYITTQTSNTPNIQNFCNHIIKSAKVNDILTTKSFCQYPNYGPKWFDSSCTKRKLETRNVLRQYRKATEPSSKEILKSKYFDLRRTYTNYIKAKRLKYLSNIDINLCKSVNPKQFYSALSYYRPKTKTSDMKEYVTPSEFEAFYSDLFSINSNNVNSSDNDDNSYENHDETLDADFTFTELNTAIKSLSRNKAAGPDNITNEIWINLNVNQRLQLLDCINDSWRNENIPKPWSEITIAPIYKKGNKNDPANYRPISLVNTILKLFTSLMTNRLNIWCDSNNKISEFQAAYKKGTGCEDHVFTLNSILQNHLKNKKNVMYGLFIDLSKAFDSINHKKLWQKLKDKGLSSKFINVIKNIYCNAKAKVRTPHGESNYFDIMKGLLQGECLSAKLFTLFIDDIVERLDKSGIASIKIGKKDVHILLYADDIVVLASNVFDLQAKIDVIRKFFEDNDLNVNLGKTKIVLFKYGKPRNNLPKVYWGENEIEFVKEYTYLGVPFYSNFNMADACQNFISKAKNAENLLFSLMYRSKIKTTHSRLTIYKSLVKSMLSYCSTIWGIDCINRLEIFQNNFLRRLYRLPKIASKWFIRMETGCESFVVSYIKNILNFWKRIVNKPSNSLIYNCYIKLKETCNYKGMKHNWYKSLLRVLNDYKLSETLDITNDDLELSTIPSQISQCVSKLKDDLLLLDIERMKASKSNPFYADTKKNIYLDNFHMLRIPWLHTSLLVQIKSNSSQLINTKLKALEFTYNKATNNICDLCSSNKV